MKKVFQVEFRGQKQKYYFETKQEAQDYALVIGGFGGKQYRIQEIFINEEVAK